MATVTIGLETNLDSGFFEVADVSELPVGALKKVKVQNREILLANIEGSVSAIDNTCPHLGGDLFLGTLQGNVLTCPRHQAKFDVTTGRCIAPPQVSPYSPKLPNLTAYSVKIENQKIFIKI
jgi:3-phenylpropionate/trans-cinnamate dioxygenase ferredoxin subunit